MAIIDYETNLDVRDNNQRFHEYTKMVSHFGYLPVYGATLQDIRQGKLIFGILIQHYPGYKWVVEVRDTVISVVNETLAPDWGFRLKEHMIDNDGKVVRQFGGQLLEQYDMKRQKADHRRLAETPKDLRGNIVRVG